MISTVGIVALTKGRIARFGVGYVVVLKKVFAGPVLWPSE